MEVRTADAAFLVSNWRWMTSVVIDRNFSSTLLTAWGDDLQVIVPTEHLLFYLLIIQLDILFRNFFRAGLPRH